MLKILLVLVSLTAGTLAAFAEESIHVSSPEGANAILQIAGQFGIKPHLLLAQIVNFAIVACILYFFVIKPIEKTLDERAKAIDEGLKRAEESEKTLQDAKTQREEIITGARREVQNLVERTQKEMMEFESQKRVAAERESAELLEKAKRDLKQEHEQQIAKAQKELAAIVVQLAEKSLEETLTPEQKQRFADKVTTSLNR